MGNIISTSVLSALLLFTPVTARQTVPGDLQLSLEDGQLVAQQAQNVSNTRLYIEDSKLIQPIEVKPTPSPVPSPQAKPKAVKATTPITPKPIPAPGELEALVSAYAAQYNAHARVMLFIMQCESGFNPNATNGPFAGLYQFMSTTWSSNRKAMGLDPDPALRYNAEEAIKTAAFKMGRDGYGAWPACSTKAFKTLSI